MQYGAEERVRLHQGLLRDRFHEDFQKFDVPTVVLHGEDGQIVPINDSARKAAKLIEGAQEIYCSGSPLPGNMR